MSIEFSADNPNLHDVQPHRGGFSSRKIDACRRLVARRYVEVGYVAEGDLDENGHLSSAVDPYVHDSEYFWTEDGYDDANDGINATIRIIHPRVYEPDFPLPIEKSFVLYAAQEQILRRARREYPTTIVEISALAKEKGVDRFATFDMYRTIWQYAKRTKIEVCAISADSHLHVMLKDLFGAAIVEAGEPADMMGSLTVPSLLYPNECASAMAQIYKAKVAAGDQEAAKGYRELINYLRDGLEPEYFSADEKAVLRSIDIEIS